MAAAIDARWDNCPDGYGIDTLFSISKDNGKTWEYTFPNFFNDSTNVYDVKEKKMRFLSLTPLWFRAKMAPSI